MVKYGDLKLIDADPNKTYTIDRMHFEKQHGKNTYFACAISEGFNQELPRDHESNFEFYDNWQLGD